MLVLCWRLRMVLFFGVSGFLGAGTEGMFNGVQGHFSKYFFLVGDFGLIKQNFITAPNIQHS